MRDRVGLAYTLWRALPSVLDALGWSAFLSRVVDELRANGWKRCVIWMAERAAYELRDDPEPYRRWLGKHRLPTASADVERDRVAIVMSLEATDDDVREAFRSLERQTHAAWDLIVVGTAGHCLPSSQRLTVVPGGGSHEARLWAALAAVHGGSHVLLMDPRCCLADQALALMLSALRSADLVYCDEDELIDGRRRSPSFKPGFSIDLERATDYVGPIVLCRGEWLAGHRPQQERLNAREIVLTAHEHRARIVRVPEVLVHWRTPRSRLQMETRASSSGARRLASVIIPTRDRIDLLSKCVESIYRFPQSNDMEVLVLNNRSVERDSFEWFSAAPSRYRGLRVIDADYAFNWSRLNNQGIALAKGDVFIFLNNDTEALSATWLDQLVRQSLREDVATVGALLLYPDLTIQHAGIVVGIGGVADHVYSGCPDRGDDHHLFVSPYVSRNVLAVTGACVAMSRRTVDDIGPFDERLAICGDLEMGVRAHVRGKLNVYDPSIRLLHHESATRRRVPLSETELARLMPSISAFVRDGDPFYHPHLSLRSRYPTFAGFA